MPDARCTRNPPALFIVAVAVSHDGLLDKITTNRGPSFSEVAGYGFASAPPHGPSRFSRLRPA
jgi:hypothetical protein